MSAYLGRLKPYSASGIKRVPCPRCGKPSTHQWQVCANARRYMGACSACDVLLNAWVLRFFRFPSDSRTELMRRYRRKMAASDD